MATETEYAYLIKDDTANGAVNAAKLKREVNADDSGVTPACISVASKITATMTGAPNLTFNDNSPSADTIVRSAGDWDADGFELGMTVRIGGSTSNNGEYLIGAVGGTGNDTLTLDPAEALTNEGPVGSVTADALDLCVTVKDVLSGGEKTSLDAVVTAHDGVPDADEVDPLVGRYPLTQGEHDDSTGTANLFLTIKTTERAPIGKVKIEVLGAFNDDLIKLNIQEHDGTSWGSARQLAEDIRLRTDTGWQVIELDFQGLVEVKAHTGDVLGSQRIQCRGVNTQSGARELICNVTTWPKI